MITIKLTESEAFDLMCLVKESSNTDNLEWDEKMKIIEKKLRDKL